MRYFVKIKNLLEINKVGIKDSAGDWENSERSYDKQIDSFWVFEDDVGTVIDVNSSSYADKDTTIWDRIDWAVDYVLTKEEYPEYYL